MMQQQNVADAQVRQRAIDPRHSFICQAPAGSGKTELLTQRFLALLAQVEQPEQIWAITFTRKAVAEMQQRINQALHSAQQPKPDTPYAQRTWALARQALQRDQQQGWQLLHNPQRLAIKTFDSLSAALVQALPFQSQLGVPPRIEADAQALYQQATEELFTQPQTEQTTQALQQLLLHRDNRWQAVQPLCVALLAQRDQWLPYILTAAHQRISRQQMQQCFDQCIALFVQQIGAQLSLSEQTELVELAQFAAPHCTDDALRQALSQVDESLFSLGSAPLSTQQAQSWQGLRHWLLTQEGRLRSRLTYHQGFPSASQSKQAEQKQQFARQKTRMQQLLQQLGERTELVEALAWLVPMPLTPLSQSQWHLAEQLCQLLPALSAQLLLVFKQHQCVDFIEISRRCLLALGDEEQPTDLTLALDYQLQHLLIDEFQDTSINQYQLIERLVQGWQPGDGRTLFCVGDPMQSIYGFRAANVGLFLQAQQQGIGPVALQWLQLQCNFRSHQGLVDWVNHSFATAMPLRSDIGLGAVPFHAAQATSPADFEAAVQCWQAMGEQPQRVQAQHIVMQIQALHQSEPQASIAILARHKSHLREVIAALQQANIDFVATQLNPLAQSLIVQELMNLTLALVHSCNRLSWCALLRSRLCGLPLIDLQQLLDQGEEGQSPQPSVWHCIEHWIQADANSRPVLQQGQALQQIHRVLQPLVYDRQRYTLRSWVETAWLGLGGHGLLRTAQDHHQYQQLMQLLQGLRLDDCVADSQTLPQAVARLFSDQVAQGENPVQLMTMHRAKGLQFDYVFLVELQASAGRGQRPLLVWHEQLMANGQHYPLLAPIHASDQQQDDYYRFLRAIQQQKQRYETVRLLYVACTRAKQRLYLYCAGTVQTDGSVAVPTASSLIAPLWSQVHAQFQSIPLTLDSLSADHSPVSPLLCRLAWDDQRALRVHDSLALQAYPLSVPEPSEPLNQPDWQLPALAQRCGTAIHALLQYLAEVGIEQVPQAYWQHSPQHLQALMDLAQIVAVDERAAAEALLEQCIQCVYADPQALKVLGHQHDQQYTEWPLLYRQRNLRLDRVIITAGCVRIIDYKTAQPQAGESLEAFAQQAHQAHSAQMQSYRQAVQALGYTRIRCELYFPLIGLWLTVGRENT